MVKGVFVRLHVQCERMLNGLVRVNYDQNISNQMLAEINYSNAIFRLFFVAVDSLGTYLSKWNVTTKATMKMMMTTTHTESCP